MFSLLLRINIVSTIWYDKKLTVLGFDQMDTASKGFKFIPSSYRTCQKEIQIKHLGTIFEWNELDFNN